MKNAEREIDLLCGTCGNNMFEVLGSNSTDLSDMPDDSRLLMQDNESLIDSNINVIVYEVTRNLEDELKKLFK